MKKKLHIPMSLRLWGLCCFLGLLFIVVGMVGCGNQQEESETHETIGTSSVTEYVTAPAREPPTSPSEDSTKNPSKEPSESPAPEVETLSNALKTYYEGVIAELRAELLQEREDRYISDFEYKRRLEELEAALEAMENATLPMDKPTVAPPETAGETIAETEPETEAETQAPGKSAIFNYRLENNEIIITAYKGKDLMVTVPGEIDGYPVTAIDDHAFQDTAVVSVILPGTVRSVGWFAFYGCYGLELVSLPASVTSINYAAFDGCPNLTLICPADSYAANYAVSFGLKHEYV